MPRILFIVPADYAALKEKGVDGMIYDRDEGGFFERVVTVHPAASRSGVIELNDVHVVHELGLDPLWRGARSRLLRLIFAPLQFVRALWVTLSLLRRERIDLIRANDPFWAGLVGLAAARISGLPWCVSIHADYDKRLELTGGGDSYTFFGLRRPARMVCRLVLSRAGLVLPIRKSLGDWAVANGARAERVRVIPHGVDCQALSPPARRDIRELFAIPRDQRIISFVGRLSPINYLDDLMQAARLLCQRRRDFCLVLAGGGELRGRLESELRENPQLAPLVRLVGFQPRELCFALREESLVSICLMGGFSLIEACLAGSPCAAYDVEWHSELVLNGSTGYLLAEGDVQGLVQAMEDALDHPEAARAMGRHARDLAYARHDLSATSAVKKRCYQELLET